MKEVSVREFLNKMKWTQDFLAKKVGCTQMCVSTWVNYNRKPKGLYIGALLEVMNSVGYTLKEAKK